MTDPNEDARLHLGRVDGKLSALESRFDRHEDFVIRKLTGIEDKLDQALLVRARNAGTIRAVHVIGSAVLSVIAWVAGHLTSSINGNH